MYPDEKQKQQANWFTDMYIYILHQGIFIDRVSVGVVAKQPLQRRSHAVQHAEKGLAIFAKFQFSPYKHYQPNIS